MARDSGGGIGTLVTWGAVGLGAYLIYQWWQSQAAAAATTAATTPPAPTTTAAATTTAPTPSAASVSALDGIYLAMVQAAAAAGNKGTLNPDQWGYYLGQVLGAPAPDPLQAFPTFNRASNWPSLTAAAYWNSMAPLVAKLKGLSGLGFFGGFGRFWQWGTR